MISKWRVHFLAAIVAINATIIFAISVPNIARAATCGDQYFCVDGKVCLGVNPTTVCEANTPPGCTFVPPAECENNFICGAGNATVLCHFR